MRVETNQYEAVTGKRARGWGLWMFEMLGERGESLGFVQSTGNYATARSTAVASAKAKELGAKKLRVCA
jgi:hypothetical protein